MTSVLRCNRYRHNCTVWSSYMLRLRDTCTCMIQSNMRRALVPTSILVDTCYMSIQRLPKWRVRIGQPTYRGCNSSSKGEWWWRECHSYWADLENWSRAGGQEGCRNVSRRKAIMHIHIAVQRLASSRYCNVSGKMNESGENESRSLSSPCPNKSPDMIIYDKLVTCAESVSLSVYLPVQIPVW